MSDTNTAVIIELTNEEDANVGAIIYDLEKCIIALGSDNLKKSIAERNIKIDMNKCSYQTKNNTVTIVFNQYLGNLIDEIIRLVKVCATGKTLEFFVEKRKRLDFFDWNKLINNECNGDVSATNIQFVSSMKSLTVDEFDFL